MKYISLFIIGILTIFSCQSPESELQKQLATLESEVAKLKANNEAEVSTGFIHTVFFWMKDGVTDDEKKTFVEKGLKELTKCPTIQNSYYGPPAHTPREVVDNSYDYAWVCHFKSKEDEAKYQDDPIHLKFIEDFKHLWDKVQVYDNLVEQK